MSIRRIVNFLYTQIKEPSNIIPIKINTFSIIYFVYRDYVTRARIRGSDGKY
jgi:hypothetical protein